jgi:Protein of unknown function (DUF2911)
MNRFLSLALLGGSLLAVTAGHAQTDKSKRPSPPAKVSQVINTGTTVSIDYSQPSVKGRTIGKDLEPLKDQVWRMGANEATVFEVDKDVTIEGNKLPAGKYSIWGVVRDNNDFNIIFNKDWDFWGTKYNEHRDSDVMSIVVKSRPLVTPIEKLTYTIDPSGKVTLLWGNMAVDFHVQ